MDSLHLRGKFVVEHWYRGKLIGLYPCNNDTTNEGKNRFLNISFHGYPPITTWYLGIIDYASYTALAATDIYRNINLAGNGWDEFTTYADQNNGGNVATRPTWTPDAAANQSIANTAQELYTISTAGIVKGLFVVGGSSNAQTKGDNVASNSILWATALFDANYPVFAGSVLRVIYTVNA